jgi:hypothetical protein
MRSVWTGIGIGVVLAACGSSSPTHVELSGKTPTEAAALAAQSFCGREARCGHAVVTCMGGGSAGGSGSDAAPPTMTCVGTIEKPSREDCTEDANEDLTDLLTCIAPTAEQLDILEICFDTLAAQPCVTQAEADAKARAAETGASPPPDDVPAACALLDDPPAACGTPTRALRGR